MYPLKAAPPSCATQRKQRGKKRLVTDHLVTAPMPKRIIFTYDTCKCISIQIEPFQSTVNILLLRLHINLLGQLGQQSL